MKKIKREYSRKFKTIKLSKKEGEKIAKSHGHGKPIKKIVFHKDFDKGMRLAVCLHCGYPAMFLGCPIIFCECKKPRTKVYELNKLEDFILKLQRIHSRKKKNLGVRR